MRRKLVLAVTCAGMFFVLLDVTIVNVALPALRHDLGLGPSGLQWVVDADTLVFACCMLPAGTLGDATGRRRLLLAGLALVGAGSALCGLATSVGPLLTGRAVQGLGGALLLPQSLALLAEAYPEPGEQARAIGVWAGASSLALPLGPLAGGVLVDRFGWPAVFWINVPVMVVALVLAARVIHEPAASGPSAHAAPSPRPAIRRLDLPGQVLVTAGIGLAIAGLITAGDAGWSAPLVVTLLLVGVVALAGFVAWEARAAQPMIPRDLVTRPGFVPANVVGTLMAIGGVGVLYLVTLLLQIVQGRSPLQAGLLLLPATLPLAVLAPSCGRLAGRVGWRLPMALGMSTAAVSGVLLLAVDAGTGPIVVGIVLLTLGLGLTLNTAPMVGAVMATASAADRSLASAANTTARQIGTALGVAVLGSIAGNPGGPGFVAGIHRAGLVAAGCWAVAALVATRAPARYELVRRG